MLLQGDGDLNRDTSEGGRKVCVIPLGLIGSIGPCCSYQRVKLIVLGFCIELFEGIYHVFRGVCVFVSGFRIQNFRI